MKNHLKSLESLSNTDSGQKSSIRYFSEKRGTREMTLLLSQMTDQFFTKPVDQKLECMWLSMLKRDDFFWENWFYKRICFISFKEHFLACSLYSEGI